MGYQLNTGFAAYSAGRNILLLDIPFLFLLSLAQF